MFRICTLLMLGLALPLLGWQSCPCPDWVSCGYIAPKAYYQNLRNKTSDHAIHTFAGLDQGKSLQGVLYGLNAGYICQNAWGFYAQFDFSYGQGKLRDHDHTTRLVYDFDVEGILGYQCAVCGLSLTPYIGIGYSFDRQRFEEETFSGDRLELRYHTYYIPVGFRMSWSITPCWELGLNFKALPQADSTLRVSIFKGARWELSKTTGYYLEMPITLNIYQRNYVWKFVLIPFWKQTSYGESAKSNRSFVILTSPRQIYNDVGLRLEAGTCF